MDTVTYSNKILIEIVNKHSLPFRIPHTDTMEIIESDVDWTPALFMITPEGKLLQKSTGFLPAEELAPWILLGKGKMQFKQKETNFAANLMEMILSDYPDSHCAPEAFYWSIVARFLSTGNPSVLQKGYGELIKHYPDSLWTKKAMPYRLL